jgi:hypothetical protein
MLTRSRIAELTLQLSGRLARLSQGARMRLTGTSVGVRAFESPIQTTAPSSAPIRTTPANRPTARRHAESTMLHKIAVFALAAALSGAAANVAAARGGGGGGGHGGGVGHMGGGIGSDFVAGSGGGFVGSHIGGFAGSPVGGFGGSFGSHLSGLSGGGFHNDPLAINTGRFTSPSALVGQHTAAAGARLNMRYRRYHGRRYYANHCFIATNDPYSCQPYSSCPCSTLP